MQIIRRRALWIVIPDSVLDIVGCKIIVTEIKKRRCKAMDRVLFIAFLYENRKIIDKKGKITKKVVEIE